MSIEPIEVQLPEGVHVEKATVLTVRPGDVLVLSTSQYITPEMADRIRQAWQQYLNMDDIRVVVLGEGLEIAAVIRKEAVA